MREAKAAMLATDSEYISQLWEKGGEGHYKVMMHTARPRNNMNLVPPKVKCNLVSTHSPWGHNDMFFSLSLPPFWEDRRMRAVSRCTINQGNEKEGNRAHATLSLQCGILLVIHGRGSGKQKSCNGWIQRSNVGGLRGRAEPSAGNMRFNSVHARRCTKLNITRFVPHQTQEEFWIHRCRVNCSATCHRFTTHHVRWKQNIRLLTGLTDSKEIADAPSSSVTLKTRTYQKRSIMHHWTVIKWTR